MIKFCLGSYFFFENWASPVRSAAAWLTHSRPGSRRGFTKKLSNTGCIIPAESYLVLPLHKLLLDPFPPIPLPHRGSIAPPTIPQVIAAVVRDGQLRME